MKKKLSLVVATILLLSTTTFAQKAYEEGSNVVNLGLGLGATYWGSGFPISIGGSFEHGVTDNISVGGTLGYSTTKINDVDGYYVRYSGILIGARGSYHFLTTDKMDPYAGADLGYVIVSESNNFPNGYTSGFKASGLGFGIHGGIRYYI